MSNIISVHDAKEKLTSQDFPKPDFSHIEETIVVNNAVWIPFSKIWIDPDSLTDGEKGNRGRAEGTTPSRINELKTSFGNGVDTNQFVPAVVPVKYLADEAVEYELLYGFGRTWSLKEMGTGGWWFNTILAGEAAREWICLSENEELPKTSNSEQDVVQSVTRLVKRGAVKNTQQGIKDAIKSNLPFRKKESRDRITAKISQNCDTPQKYIYYTEQKARDWKKNHCKDEFLEFGGVRDELRDEYGFICKEGTLYRFVHRAVKTYASTGKKSYAVLHMQEPTEKSDIPSKRAGQVEEFENLKSHYEKCGMKTDFMYLLGALPQEVGIDNLKELVSLY